MVEPAETGSNARVSVLIDPASRSGRRSRRTAPSRLASCVLFTVGGNPEYPPPPPPRSLRVAQSLSHALYRYDNRSTALPRAATSILIDSDFKRDNNHRHESTHRVCPSVKGHWSNRSRRVTWFMGRSAHSDIY